MPNLCQLKGRDVSQQSSVFSIHHLQQYGNHHPGTTAMMRGSKLWHSYHHRVIQGTRPTLKRKTFIRKNDTKRKSDKNSNDDDKNAASPKENPPQPRNLETSVRSVVNPDSLKTSATPKHLLPLAAVKLTMVPSLEPSPNAIHHTGCTNTFIRQQLPR